MSEKTYQAKPDEVLEKEFMDPSSTISVHESTWWARDEIKSLREYKSLYEVLKTDLTLENATALLSIEKRLNKLERQAKPKIIQIVFAAGNKNENEGLFGLDSNGNVHWADLRSFGASAHWELILTSDLESSDG